MKPCENKRSQIIELNHQLRSTRHACRTAVNRATVWLEGHLRNGVPFCLTLARNSELLEKHRVADFRVGKDFTVRHNL
jgi:hypothetical protein